MSLKLRNNMPPTSIVGGITASETTITLATGAGASLPTLRSGDYLRLTLGDPADVSEIVSVVAVTGDVLTVIRGAEGSTAVPWVDGAPVNMLLTLGGLLNRNETLPGLARASMVAELYVSSVAGNDVTGTGSITQPFASFEKALAYAEEFDSAYVAQVNMHLHGNHELTKPVVWTGNRLVVDSWLGVLGSTDSSWSLEASVLSAVSPAYPQTAATGVTYNVGDYVTFYYSNGERIATIGKCYQSGTLTSISGVTRGQIGLNVSGVVGTALFISVAMYPITLQLGTGEAAMFAVGDNIVTDYPDENSTAWWLEGTHSGMREVIAVDTVTDRVTVLYDLMAPGYIGYFQIQYPADVSFENNAYCSKTRIRVAPSAIASWPIAQLSSHLTPMFEAIGGGIEFEHISLEAPSYDSLDYGLDYYALLMPVLSASSGGFISGWAYGVKAAKPLGVVSAGAYVGDMFIHNAYTFVAPYGDIYFITMHGLNMSLTMLGSSWSYIDYGVGVVFSVTNNAILDVWQPSYTSEIAVGNSGVLRGKLMFPLGNITVSNTAGAFVEVRGTSTTSPVVWCYDAARIGIFLSTLPNLAVTNLTYNIATNQWVGMKYIGVS